MMGTAPPRTSPKVGEEHPVPEYSPAELVQKWEEFFDAFDYAGRILSIADAYPETRSLEVPFEELNRFDTDFAIYFLRHPANAIAAGEEAITRVAPPGDEPIHVHLRVKAVPRDARIMARDLRAEHLGRFVTVDGLVRKATEVRPRVVDAMFRCLRCNAVIKEPQEGTTFREPMECAADQGGCGRAATSTKFTLLGEQSQYLDTQKIEIQEPPEILRGGEEPQRLEAYIEDDITGQITPGERVVLNGILRSAQRGRPGAKSTIFDIFLDVSSVEMEQVEFEEIEITPADVERIREEAARPGMLDRVVQSIAPAIYGLEREKEALALQLFGGVTKRLPDGTRIRGDSHLLLVGDPGCLVGDERVIRADGTVVKLEKMGERHLQPIRVQVRLGAGSGRNAWATRFHRYERQPVLELTTETGKCIKGTYDHPLLAWNPSARRGEWKRLDELRVGDRLRVASSIQCTKAALVPTGWTEPRYYHRSWHVKVPPHVDEGLAAIMGYVLGDGWTQKRRIGFMIAQGELDLARTMIRLFKTVFGVRPNRQARRGKVDYYQVDRTPIARWLSVLSEKRVPDSILASRNSVVSSFLKWLFEADGSCFAKGRGRTAITLRSMSLELLRDVQVLLLRWGIHARILWSASGASHSLRGSAVNGGPNGSLVVRQTESILQFARHVGFASRKKTARLRAVVESVSGLARRRHRKNSERIVSIRPAGLATVYDIEVPGPQRFIANGIVSHNTAKSQLLLYMSQVAPRGIMVSGKGTSAAGLLAAAVRDDFGEGRWTLEAGALVLSDRGVCFIDEIEKMSPQDRGSIHQAMEEQMVHISKAGITATLPARCAVLAAANPQFGRFVKEKYLGDQINLEPALLSRFDAIFVIQDIPEAKRDKDMADHILQGHLLGEVQRARDETGGSPVPEPMRSTHVPYYEPEFLRKYVAFAKRFYPVMTPDAMARIRDHYLEIRREAEAGTVPITPRQLEAFVRFAEASARTRLSPLVDIQDADRAVGIIEYWLRQVAMEAGGGGHIDIDIVATGVPASQRDQIVRLRDIIAELGGTETGPGANHEDIVSLADQRGIPRERAEAWLRKWKQEGELYSPVQGVYRLVARL